MRREALAANVRATGGDEGLTGTESRDTIDPFDGNDTAHALGGDFLSTIWERSVQEEFC